jgi:hypothetical protein
MCREGIKLATEVEEDQEEALEEV